MNINTLLNVLLHRQIITEVYHSLNCFTPNNYIGINNLIQNSINKPDKKNNANRTMTGSNSIIATTRLTDRQQITGSNYTTVIRQFKHISGFKKERCNRIIGKRVST